MEGEINSIIENLKEKENQNLSYYEKNYILKAIKYVNKYWEKINELNDFELGYIAGLIDGEGSIRIVYANKGHGKKAFVVQINVWNTDPEVIFWLKRKLGGSIIVEKKDIKRRRYRPLFRWTLSGNFGVFCLLSKIKDKLIVKKETAKIVYDFCKTKIYNLGKDNEVVFMLFNEYKEIKKREKQH